MNILMIGPDRTNATDGMIIKGIEALLSRVATNYTIIYKNLTDSRPQDLTQFESVKPDLIVLCGTPWLWDSFQNSHKYKNLLSVFNLYKSVNKLVLGAGSCLPLASMTSDLLKRPQEVAGIQTLFSGTTVIARDSLAFNRFTNAGIAATFLPCPAYYCLPDSFQLSSNRTPSIIFQDPAFSISSTCWTSTTTNALYSKMIEYQKTHNATVYIAAPVDARRALEIGLTKKLNFLKNSDDTLEMVRTTSQLLSVRVHCAVPARAAGVPVEHIALDSRHLVLKDFENCTDFSVYLPEYDKIIKKVL